jgi:hypothetical protein
VYLHSSFASYEPELFPGLIYRLASPRVVFLIFVSGKIVITGAKTERDVTDAFTKLYPVLSEFRKAAVAPIGSVGRSLAITTPVGGPSTATNSSSNASTALISNVSTNNDQREMELV